MFHCKPTANRKKLSIGLIFQCLLCSYIFTVKTVSSRLKHRLINHLFCISNPDRLLKLNQLHRTFPKLSSLLIRNLNFFFYENMYFPVSKIQRLKLLSYCLFFFLTHCIHLITIFYHFWGFPGGTSGKEPTCQCRRHEMLVLSPGGRAWQSTPVFLPGESHGRGDWWATVHRVV